MSVGGNILARWRTALDDHQARRQLRQELARMPSEEVERLLADAGLSRADLNAPGCHPSQAEQLLPRMLAALDLADRAAEFRNLAQRRDLERTCTACGEGHRCRRELDAGTAAQHYEEFCLNAHSLDGMRAQ